MGFWHILVVFPRAFFIISTHPSTFFRQVAEHQRNGRPIEDPAQVRCGRCLVATREDLAQDGEMTGRWMGVDGHFFQILSLMGQIQLTKSQKILFTCLFPGYLGYLR